MRGIAIAIVVIHNAGFVLQGSTALLPKLASAITATGWIGVQLFFVLSGYLITGILLDARGTGRFFRSFYIRRTLRIFPLYYGFLAIAFFLVPVIVTVPAWAAVARENQWWYWTYTSNWGSPFGHVVPGLSHYWSLAVEEQFYLFWPLLVFLVSPRGLIGLCLAAIATTPLIRLALRASGLAASAGYVFTIARWDALAVGALLAILLREEKGSDWLRRHMGRIGLATILVWAVFVVVERGFHEDDLHVQVLGQSIVSIVSAALIYACVMPSSDIARAVRNALAAPWLRFLGKYSYAMYVFHYPIHFVAAKHFGALVNGADTNGRLFRLSLYVAGVAAVSILAAMGSWRILEEPFLKLKDRFAPRPASPRGHANDESVRA